MYNLSYFKEKNNHIILDFVNRHPFAFLAGCNENNQPVATQVPLLIEEKDGKIYLVGHLMKNTDHHNAFERNNNVLCVFTGPHTYVSARWYSNPSQASTWNYMSVHMRGELRFLDEYRLKQILQKTSLHFEGGDIDSPTTYDNLPTDYISRLINAIIAFEIEVKEIENVFKLSQNRDEESYQNIIEKLRNGDGDGKQIAEEMEKRKPALFKNP